MANAFKQPRKISRPESTRTEACAIIANIAEALTQSFNYLRHAGVPNAIEHGIIANQPSDDTVDVPPQFLSGPNTS